MAGATFKVTLVGDGGAGKTTFLKQIQTGEFETQYVATVEDSLAGCPIRRHARSGVPVVFDVYDTAGQHKFASAAAATWAGTDAFLVMFDLTRRLSYTNAEWWIERAIAVCPTAPIVLVGTKSESPARKLTPSQVTLHSKFGIPYVEVSARANETAAPFECLEALLVK